MTNEEYHADPRISASLLRRCYPSAAHALHALQNPVKPTRAMDLGTAIHCAALTPDRFADEVWVKPADPGFRKKDGTPADSPWLTAEGKALVAAKHAAGVAIIDESDAIHVHQCAEVFRAWLGQYSGEKVFERPHFAGDSRCKPDCLIIEPDRVTCVSVKTSAKPARSWTRTIWSTDEEGGYDVSEAHYAAILAEVYARPIVNMFLHLPSSGPVILSPFIVPPHIMETGEANRQQALKHLADARAGIVPRIAPTLVLEIPRWITADQPFVEVEA